MNYHPEQYWQKRLSQDFSLAATGHSGYSRQYNRWMYRLRACRLDAALRSLGIAVRGKEVLDIGSGTGFFVEYYLRRQAAGVNGVDITDVSVQTLRRRFPGQVFQKIDISCAAAEWESRFDIVNAFDVLYHIVDDAGFSRALHAICGACKPGAWIFITDGLNPQKADSDHVRYRSLGTYTSLFKKEGVAVKEVRPVFCRMAARSAGYAPGSLVSRLQSKVIDMAAPLDYFCDRLHCHRERATMWLLLCQKN